MSKIAIVGTGFIGSLLAVECAKREFAHAHGHSYMLIDGDKFDGERNPANQACTVDDDGKPKVHVCAEIIRAHSVEAEGHYTKVTDANIAELLGPASLIVDAVDHLPTRQLLWTYGVTADKPVLHVGVSLGGTGRVEWNDDFSLSPLSTAGMTDAQLKAISAVASGELPPCQLVAYRGLGLNTAIATAKALYIYLGFDPEKHVPNVLPGTMTWWRSSNEGHILERTVEPSDAD